MLVDFHVHTIYSNDACISIKDVKQSWKKKGLICAITDHNTTKAWEKLREASIPFIPGEEIETKQGEVIGLFLNEEIKKGLDFYEVKDLIKEQGGILYAPHPFDVLRKGLAKTNEELIKACDIVEVLNGRTWNPYWNIKAKIFAEKYGLAKAGGSDAHLPWEIGKVTVKIEAEWDELENSNLIKLLSKSIITYNLFPLPLPFVGRIVRWLKK